MMTWDSWYEEAREKAPHTEPLKWLESVITQDVMEDPRAHQAMGRLYARERVPLASLEVPNHSYNWQHLYDYLVGQNMHVGVRELEGGNIFCVISDETEEQMGKGVGSRVGLAMCLAAVEWHRNRTSAGMDELLEQ